jgi:DUF1009 family protein
MHTHKIAVIAGNGVLPAILINALEQQGIQPHLIAFHGQTNLALKPHTPALWGRLGKTGAVLNYLQNEDITDIIMIGGMKRPKLWQLWPDFETLKFFVSLGFDRGGDDHFLKKLEAFLNARGLQVRGAHEFLQDHLAPEGPIGALAPPDSYKNTIELGIRESQKLGAADLGQSVVVQGNKVIAREDKSGTDALITRAAQLIDPALPPPLLVKTCKPQQDKRFDLPTIGLHTIEKCAAHGYAGIITHAGASFLINKEKLAQSADLHNMFVVGASF